MGVSSGATRGGEDDSHKGSVKASQHKCLSVEFQMNMFFCVSVNALRDYASATADPFTASPPPALSNGSVHPLVS